jgi:hypothetical protein
VTEQQVTAAGSSKGVEGDVTELLLLWKLYCCWDLQLLLLLLL